MAIGMTCGHRGAMAGVEYQIANGDAIRAGERGRKTKRQG
jgi:hypothetical protein